VNIWAKIGWGLLGLLVLASVAVMFLLHWVMGVGFAAFVVLVLWYVFGVIKKKTDVRIKALALALGLDYQPHPFRYAAVAGVHRGRPVRISYQGGRRFGAGSVLAVTTGSPGWAGLDITNLTMISLEHGRGKLDRRTLEPGPPLVLVKGERLLLLLPGVCLDGAVLKDGLARLAQAAEELEAG